MSNNDKDSNLKPWYSIAGFEDDVIISSRLRICRNLSDFMFPQKLQSDEIERIRGLLLEAVNFENDKNINFNFVDVKELSDQGKMILMERNILSVENCDCVFMSENGNFFCRVCESDHVKLAAFKSGLSFQQLFEKVYFIDEKMQEKQICFEPYILFLRQKSLNFDNACDILKTVVIYCFKIWRK
jgi:protein arginine kinase